MAVEVVMIFASTCVVFLVPWFLRSRWSRNFFRWISVICTRHMHPHIIGFIPVQENERAVIGKQFELVGSKCANIHFSSLV